MPVLKRKSNTSMKTVRVLFACFIGIVFVFLAYVASSGAFPDSIDILGIQAFALGPAKSSERILFYNRSDSLSEIRTGSEWKADRYLSLGIVNPGESFPGVTFYLKETIPPDASLSFRWRARGVIPRLLIDITDGKRAPDLRPGENYYSYADVPGGDWTSVSIPLPRFQRNEIQPPGAPSDGRFDTEGIQAVSITFFPHTNGALDIQEVQFEWRSHQWASLSFIAGLFLIGLFLWRRTTEKHLATPAGGSLFSQESTPRLVYVFLAATVVLAVMRRDVNISGISALLTFGGLFALVILDDMLRASWTQYWLWSYRYAAVVLFGWYTNVVHDPVLVALLLSIAYVAPVYQRSRFVLASIPLLALTSLLTHPQVVLSTTFAAGLGVIAGTSILALMGRGVLEHQQAQYEAQRMRSLYEKVLANTSDSIYILDREGVIKAANRGFENLLGRTNDEIVGRNIRGFIHTDDHKFLALEEREALELGVSRNYDLRFLHSAGEARTALVREVVVSQDVFGKEFQVIATDITERKLAEAERERLVAELQNAMAEVKILGGLIPICAWCKKIRDDQGYWTQLEGYIQSHSEARFTHGICPECSKEF